MKNLPELNSSQADAVRSPMAPLLVVAGAGTGKTRTLTSRLIYLIQNGVPPHRICAITFTNKAAREMAARVAKGKEHIAYGKSGKPFTIRRVPYAAGGAPFIGTFHSLCAKILRKEAGRVGRTPSFVIYDDGDALSLMKKIVKSFPRSASYPGPAPLLKKISHIKNGMSSPNDPRASARAEDSYALAVFEAYEKKLEELNAFDFDDLIEKTVRVFEAFPARLAQYQRMYPHVLVDEYQDVNHTQYAFLKLLAHTAESVSAVGDDAQMIYGWRGSHIETFLNFERDWPRARTVFLEENYRSSGCIVRAASAVIAHNTLQSDARNTKELRTRNPEGIPVRVVEHESDGAEAEWIVSQIARPPGLRPGEVGQAKGKSQSDDDSRFAIRSVPSIAILYRTNAQSRPIEQALLERGIPYRIYGGIAFYERREVKDVLAALRMALNPRDEISRERLQKNLTKSRFSGFEEALSPLRRERPLPPAELIELFLKSADYFAHLDRQFTDAPERKENVASLLEFAREHSSLPLFIERVSLLQANDEIANRKARGAERDTEQSARGDSRCAAHLMTIHLAKGLEFDRVYLAGAREGHLPHARSLGTLRELEEERRLMYVAMTRARKELTISFYDIPSRFVSEIPEDAMAFTSFAGEHARVPTDEERYIALD